LHPVHRHEVGRTRAPDRTALDDRRYRNEPQKRKCFFSTISAHRRLDHDGVHVPATMLLPVARPQQPAACATTVVDVTAGEPKTSEPDLAEELELRDELLLVCREVLLGVGTRQASALVAHIDALLDLDDGASPGSDAPFDRPYGP
jgi:hypothetical protein